MTLLCNKCATLARAVVILSDGEDNEPGAIEKTQELRDKSIHIYTIAVGETKPVPIPFRSHAGDITEYKKHPSGQLILTERKDTFLEKLATEGNGQFYTASFGGNEVKALLTHLDTLKKQEFASARMQIGR